MTFDLLLSKDGRTYIVIKRDMVTGEEIEFTRQDVESLLDAERRRLHYEEMAEKVRDVARRLQG